MSNNKDTSGSPVVAQQAPRQPVQGIVMHPGYPQAQQPAQHHVPPPPPGASAPTTYYPQQPHYHESHPPPPAPGGSTSSPSDMNSIRSTTALYPTAAAHHHQQHHHQPQWSPTPLHQLPESSSWTSELFDCGHDVHSCVDVIFCRYCQMSRQYNVVSYGKQGLELWSCMGSFVLDMMIGFNIGSFFLTWHLRQKIRHAYNIPGEDIRDCLESYFCTPCALCQQYRELSSRSDWPGATLHSERYIAPPVVLERMNREEMQPRFISGGVDEVGGGSGGQIYPSLPPSGGRNNTRL